MSERIPHQISHVLVAQTLNKYVKKKKEIHKHLTGLRYQKKAPLFSLDLSKTTAEC